MIMYVLYSYATKMPYVACDAETMEDQIFLYLKEEDAKREIQRRKEEGDMVALRKIEQKDLGKLGDSILDCGIDRIVIGSGTTHSTVLPVSEMFKRENTYDPEKDPRAITNPGLHLTMLYFKQALDNKTIDRAMVKELDAQMKGLFLKARLLFPLKGDQTVMLEKNGDRFQPVFTDFQEFMKFKQGDGWKLTAIDTEVLIKHFPKELRGVAVNPSGVNAVFEIQPKKS